MDRAEVAAAKASELEPRLAKLTLRIPPTPGIEIQRATEPPGDGVN